MSRALKQKLVQADRQVAQAVRYGDTDAVESATRSRRQVVVQLHKVQERVAERGTLGAFPDGTSLLAEDVLSRRKRSAVTIGETAQLPLVSDAKRASPNYLLRAAVFAVVEKGHRATLMRARVAAQDGFEVYFSGIQLDQADLDVWLHCLHLSSGRLGEKVDVGLLQFLRDIGRTEGAASQEWLRNSLVRLSMAVIQVKHEGVTVMVHDRMVVYEEREQVSKSAISLRVSPTMANLFGVARWTALDMSVRTRLVGQPFTQWLHAYLSTHAKPLPMPVSTLRELSGSRVSELRMFRRSLKQAADRLVAKGFLKRWELSADDKLQVERA